MICIVQKKSEDRALTSLAQVCRYASRMRIDAVKRSLRMTADKARSGCLFDD